MRSDSEKADSMRSDSWGSAAHAALDHYRAGRIADAEQTIRDTFAAGVVDETNRGHAVVMLRLMAICQFEVGRHHDAIQTCAQAEQVGGQAPDVYAIAAKCAEAMGDELQAFGCWSAAHVFRSSDLVAGSGTWLAQVGMGRILARAGNLAAAATHFCDALESTDDAFTPEKRVGVDAELADVRRRWAEAQQARAQDDA